MLHFLTRASCHLRNPQVHQIHGHQRLGCRLHKLLPPSTSAKQAAAAGASRRTSRRRRRAEREDAVEHRRRHARRPPRTRQISPLPHRRQPRRPLPAREPRCCGEELGGARAVADRVRHAHPQRAAAAREPRGLERERRAVHTIAGPRGEAVEQVEQAGVDVGHQQIKQEGGDAWTDGVHALGAIRLVVAKFGTSSALERSRNKGHGKIHNALSVLDLVPTKHHHDREEVPSHHRLINDCMSDILGVQSRRNVMRKRKEDFVNSSSNEAWTKGSNVVPSNISVCPPMTRFTKEDVLMQIVELHRRGGVSSDASILVSALSSCADRKTLTGGAQLQALLVKVGYDSSVLVGSSLISFYSRCGQLENAHRVFQGMAAKNTVSWTALISGYAQDNQVEPCLHLFALMRQSVCKPNDITFATIFSVCTNHAFLALGKSVQGMQMKMGFDSYVHVSNALISMYAKCGSIDQARSIFESIACKDLVSWNSMIFGYSQHGLADYCLDLLKEMEGHIMPDAISFLGILSSCRHACLVSEGRRCFRAMIEHGIKPELDHYSCMVDLLGRAGLLDEAWDLIQTMPMAPNGVIWGSLLASCRAHRSVSIGIQAAEHRLKLEPGCAATHVQLANLYASIGSWTDVARVRKVMKERGLKTNIGCSWIEVGNKVYTFTAENRSKSQVNDVLAVLDCLQSHMDHKYDILIDGLHWDDLLSIPS